MQRVDFVFKGLGVLFAAAAGIIGLSSYAQEAATEPVYDLTKATCAQVQAMPEEEQGYILVLLFGYHAGETKAALQTETSIRTKIRTAHESCKSNPEMPAIDAFRI